MQVVGLVGEQEGRPGAHLRHQEPLTNLGNLLRQQGRGQVSRHFVERPDTALPATCDIGLIFVPGGKLTYHQAHDQHHGEGHQVLNIADREGHPWRDEEEVEDGHA